MQTKVDPVPYQVDRAILQQEVDRHIRMCFEEERQERDQMQLCEACSGADPQASAKVRVYSPCGAIRLLDFLERAPGALAETSTRVGWRQAVR